MYCVYNHCSITKISKIREGGIQYQCEDIRFTPCGVLVVWEWEWLDGDTNDHISESSAKDVSHDHHNPHIKADTESDSEQETDFWLLSQTHTVTFKCIGATHDFHAQGDPEKSQHAAWTRRSLGPCTDFSGTS